jgi:predicted secreted protein
MAQAKVMNGRKLLIKVSDGASTPTFAHPCLINAARGIAFASETNSINIPDCDDPDLVTWVGREKRGLSASINGAGVLHTPDTEVFFDWVKSSTPKAVRVELNGVTGGANGGGYWGGNFHLTTFEVSGDDGEKVQCSLSMESDGAIAWTDAA